MKNLLITFLLATIPGTALVAAPLPPLTTDKTVTSTTREFSDGIAGKIEKIVANHRGDMGVYCRHLDTGEVIAINANEPFPTASTIKTPVMCAAMDILVKGDGPYKSYYDTLTYDASTSTGGSGFIRNYQDGTRLELKELIHLMMTVSDNIATNMIGEWIGLDTVNTWCNDHGLTQTRIFSTVGGSSVADPEGRKQWGLGRTTPYEMGALLEMIATGKAGTTTTTEEMLRVLGHQYFDDRIAAGTPPMTWVGSKSGSVSRSRSDCAIIASPAGTYILTVFTKNNEDTRWINTGNEAELAIRDISLELWNHFNPQNPWQITPGIEKF